MSYNNRHNLIPMDIEKNLKADIFHDVVNNLFVRGELTELDLNLSKKELIVKISKLIGYFDGIVIDYRFDILSQAEVFYENGNYEYAKVFYAMFFEHSLNCIIENECYKRKIDKKMQIEITKNINIQGKLTWLLALFGYKKFNQHHLVTIKKLIDNRNAFIHYKWQPIPDNNEDIKLQMDKEFEKIKSAVKYMKCYEAFIFYEKNKGKLNAKIKSFTC